MKNKKKKYSYMGNLGFMVKNHWAYDKSYIILQISDLLRYKQINPPSRFFGKGEFIVLKINHNVVYNRS